MGADRPGPAAPQEISNEGFSASQHGFQAPALPTLPGGSERMLTQHAAEQRCPALPLVGCTALVGEQVTVTRGNISHTREAASADPGLAALPAPGPTLCSCSGPTLPCITWLRQIPRERSRLAGSPPVYWLTWGGSTSWGPDTFLLGGVFMPPFLHIED